MARGGKMAEIVEVDEKGRIVIPSSIRDKLGIERGAKLVLEVGDNEIVLSRIDVFQPKKEESQELKAFLRTNPKTANV